MKHEDDDTTHQPTIQRVQVWLELGSSDGAGAVEVGQPTTLGIRARLPDNIGAHIVDCAALDGLGEASQKLLDERGCPIDEQVKIILYIFHNFLILTFICFMVN